MIDRAIGEMCPRINPTSLPYKMTEIGNGRTAIDLDDESDTVHLEPSQDYIGAQANSEKTRDSNSLLVSDDEDDIYVVKVCPVKKRMS